MYQMHDYVACLANLDFVHSRFKVPSNSRQSPLHFVVPIRLVENQCAADQVFIADAIDEIAKLRAEKDVVRFNLLD